MEFIKFYFFRYFIPIGILLGIALLLLAGYLYNQGKSWDKIIIITVAELGAVILATALIHLVHEMSMKKEYKALKNLKSHGLRIYHKTLSDYTLKKKLAKSKNITVLKTFFPETDNLKEGLKTSLENNGSIELILLDPDSDLLSKRSMSAASISNHGRDHVIAAICMIYDWKFISCIDKKKKSKIYLFDEWPGSPLIQLDDSILLGYYWIGNSSPAFPWMEIKNRTELHSVLDEQIKIIRNNHTTPLININQFEAFALQRNFELPTK